MRYRLVLLMALCLGVAQGTQYLYEQAFQVPACLEYARTKGLPVEHLRVDAVIPAGKQDRHVCSFRHEQREERVILEFDRGDIPRGLDNGQIAATIGSAFLAYAVFLWLWRRRAAPGARNAAGAFRRARRNG